MPRRRRSSKPLIPGLGWLLFMIALLALIFGLFGALSHFTRFERAHGEAAPAVTTQP